MKKTDELSRPYNLLISNGYSEKQFVKNYGKDLFEKLRKEAFALDNGRCAGCGHEPPDDRKDECLFFHIYEVNDLNPELSKGTTLCKMCHMTQHIDAAIKKNWVSFVNSIYDQNNIIRLIRGNQIYNSIQNRAIVQLSKPPEQFLKDFYAGDLKFTSTLKVVFNNNFNIDDLY